MVRLLLIVCICFIVYVLFEAIHAVLSRLVKKFSRGSKRSDFEADIEEIAKRIKKME